MTAEDDAALGDALNDKSRVTVRRASFIGVDANGRATINLGTSRFPAEFATAVIPEVNETVHILSVDGKVFLLGSTAAKPGQGTVVSVSAPYVTVSTAIGNLTMPYTGTAPAATNKVAISWSEGPRCVGVLSTSPPPPSAAPDPTPGGGVRSATFLAGDAGSTDRSSVRWWTDQPWASTSTYGAWFYGSQIKDTIPSGSTLVSLEFYVSYAQRQGGSPNFALHNQPSKAGLPSYSASTAWNPEEGWQVPPNPATWFNGLAAGGAYYGIGLDQGGYNKFRSRAQDGQTGALRIAWRQ